jgi:predicted enzyme related to lactoylglutathione lyase
MMSRSVLAILAVTAGLMANWTLRAHEARAGVVSPAAAQAGEFVWHDLVTVDAEASRAFYAALFGWTFEAAQGVDPGYTIIRHEGQWIGGIVEPRDKSQADVAQWLAYVVVADVDRAADAFTQSGGRIFRGPLWSTWHSTPRRR